MSSLAKKTSPPIDVAVLGYDPLRLVGLRAVLESEGEFAIHRVEPEDLGRPLPGDLVLIGTHGLGSVFDAIAAIRTLRPEAKMILTSTSTSEEAMVRAIFAGVKGYLDEAAPAEDYMQALHVVKSGSVWIRRRVLAKFIDRVVANPRKIPGASRDITDREQQVLELLVAGRTNKEIGNELGIEERTVKLHVSRLMRKAGVDNRIALSVHAVTKLSFKGE